MVCAGGFEGSGDIVFRRRSQKAVIIGNGQAFEFVHFTGQIEGECAVLAAAQGNQAIIRPDEPSCMIEQSFKFCLFSFSDLRTVSVKYRQIKNF